MKIGPNDLVLDVGSGHNPDPRSDVLCDRYIDDDTERGGSIRVDRPLIVGDGHNLPFKDKAFDYVIASHIIEHMDDPARFCSELMRVARRGFIASPTELAEHMFYWSFHKWYVNKVGNKLILHPKVNVPNMFGELFDYLYEHNPWYARFHRSLPDMFWMEYEWDGVIQVEIRDRSPLDLDNPRALKRMAIPRESLPTSLKRGAVTLADHFLPQAAHSLITRVRRARRAPARKINLEDILACPACGGDVQIRGQGYERQRGAIRGQDHQPTPTPDPRPPTPATEGSFVTCRRCARVYPIEQGFPMMLLDQEMRHRPPDAAASPGAGAAVEHLHVGAG